MKITLLPSACSPADRELQYLTCFKVNDTLAIDAGSLGLAGTPEEQARVRHVLLSHTHVDHLASLPIYLENVFREDAAPPTIYGSGEVLNSLRRDVFNNRLWPDFILLTDQGAPLISLRELLPGQPFPLEGLTITPVPVNHSVPTLGFILDDGSSSVIIVGDTGPTQAIWKAANRLANLRAVFLEVSFPEEMSRLARIAGHLTPSLFAAELRKLKRPARVIAVHIKARFRQRIMDEMHALRLANVEYVAPGETYQF